MMNWYYSKNGETPKRVYMVDKADRNGVYVDTAPLIDGGEWEVLAGMGWFRGFLASADPYRDGYQEPVIAPHPADGLPCAFIAPGERYTLEELRVIKAREVTLQIPQHTGADLASDARLGRRVADVVTWAGKVYALIAATEGWEAVASVDTSLPDPLGLTPEEVAAVICEQEEDILMRDVVRNALGYGMPVTLREELQEHLRAVDACVDTSDEIPAIPVGFRQKVYVPDESSFIILLSRFPEGGGFRWRANIVSDDPDLKVWVAEYSIFFRRVNPLVEMSAGTAFESRRTVAQFVDIRVGSFDRKVTGLIELPPVGGPVLRTIYYGGSVKP